MPTGRLPVEGLVAISLPLPLRKQNTSATRAKRIAREDPRAMPTIAPVVNPFFLSPFSGDGGPSEPGLVRELGGEWLRLWRDLPGGGAVYGGGGGAGPFAKEFPSYLSC